MKALDNVRNNVARESVAYGYTLSVWGSGALLLNNFAMNSNSILAFVLGGVMGFALLASVSFKGLFKPVEYPDVDHIAASMIHVFASLGSVLITYMVVTNVETASNLLLFGLGAHVTVTYNIMLILEEFISEDIYRFETR